MKRLCQVLQICRSAYYRWRNGQAGRQARQAADEALANRIRAIHDHDAAYGVPRVTAELNDGVAADQRVNHKRVARVMRQHHLAGVRLRGRVRTTIPALDAQTVSDLLKRDFTATEKNVAYVGDITYLPLADGRNLYLATVIDCFSRRLTGWAVADHMRTSLVEDALKMARDQRGSLRNAIFHADHGAQYTSKAFAVLCEELGVRRSRAAVGSSAANALAESFNAALKREVLQGARTWPDEATCRSEVFRWNVRYNTKRRHSYCCHMAPAVYEKSLPTTLPLAA